MAIDLSKFTPVQVTVMGKDYTYKMSENLLPYAKVGDLVIVDFGTKGYQVGTVRSIGEVPLDPNAKFRYKWVVSIVTKGDLRAYQQILDVEAAARYRPATTTGSSGLGVPNV